jgi:2-methylcitrate dehydratase
VDKTTETITDYASSFSANSLGEAAMGALLDRMVDSVACILAGTRAEPARIATQIARSVHSDPAASVFGEGTRTSPEMAAFANTIMVRAFDYNDGGVGAHSSDMIPGLLAAGESIHASGLDVLVAIALAYEVAAGLGTCVDLKELGWDQGTFLGPATAVGVGRLLGLSHTQLGEAVSLALVPHVAMRVTRAQALSMWKGCATAVAVRDALFAVTLARNGMTGPPLPFEGRHGLWQQVTGQFELALPAQPDGVLTVQRTNMKAFPAESHSLALLEIIPRVREWATLDEIERVEIETYRGAYTEIGGDPEKWDPRIRETADHSLPYLLAVALVDGQVTLSSFEEQRILDPALRPVMNKISVREDPQLTAQFATRPQARITVRTSTGREFHEETGYPKGNVLNPMTRDDINAKFDRVCSGWISDDRRDRIREAWWNVASATDIANPIQTLIGFAD